MSRVSLLVERACPWISRGQGRGGKKIVSAVKTAILVVGIVGLGYFLGASLMTASGPSAIAVVSILALLFLAVAEPLYGLVINIVLYPLSVHFATIQLGKGIPNISPDRLVIACLLAVFFFRTMTGRQGFHYRNRVYLAALFFLVFYSLSFRNQTLTFSAASQFLLDKWMLPIVVYFIVSNLVVDERKLHGVLNLLLGLGVYSAVYMMYEQATGSVLFEVRQEAATFYTGTGLRIVRGLYGTTTTFGNLFNLLIPVALYFFLKARTVGKKAWYGLAFLVMLAGVLLTYKRAVWLGAIVSFLIICWFYPQFRKLFVVILFVFSLGIAASWDTVSRSEVVTSRITGTDDWQDANGRTQRWEAGMEYWRQNPLFGAGYKIYKQGEYEQVENLYIHLLASAGLVAFVPFVIMLLSTVRDSVDVFRRLGKRMFVERNLITIFWGGFGAYWFMAYFGSGIEGHPISNYTLFVMMGAIVGSQVPLLGRSAREPKCAQDPGAGTG